MLMPFQWAGVGVRHFASICTGEIGLMVTHFNDPSSVEHVAALLFQH